MDLCQLVSSRDANHTQPDPALPTLQKYVWTQERSNRLVELWRDPACYSATQIAEMLDGNFTRNAILGRVHRLIKKGLLQGRPPNVNQARSPNPNQRPKEKQALQDIKRREKIAQQTIQERPRPGGQFHILPTLKRVDDLDDGPDMPRIEFSELKVGICKYPLGDEPPFLFCGKPAAPGHSWCACHCLVVYNMREAS